VIDRTISHYRITRELGAGGMGVVYEAVDTKLDRRVALKFLPPESTRDSDAKARFIHEAKAASSLDHPNICTIHGIEETDDGRLFIAMARYEGETLKDMIERGALEVPTTLDIITQVLQGLAKAHRLGIVHRDIKPANVFVTEDGLVKLLDFGIAKLIGKTQVTKTGALVGTVHYMAPEQLQGEEVDRRADLWSVGVLLYEMLTGQLPFKGDHPPAIMYAILNTDPEPLVGLRDDIPRELVEAVRRCLSKPPADRPQSVEDLLLTLKSLAAAGPTQTLRARNSGSLHLAKSEFVHPYPGLASFNEGDTEFFHGRESSVEAVWQKLRRGRLLAVTGPSGVGKTSFLQAGLIPAKPADWGVIFAKPGASPLLSLREALVREISGDTEGIVALLRENDADTDVATMKRWRANHDEALVVLDQFEELFTLNPRPQQERFAELLSRLTFEADVHILVSLRDDFLYHCRNHPGLAPLFESLTVLVPLTGSTLRLALVQPALDCGFQFEDETLVDEMMAEVEGERGALPLLAFSMARLWEHRDRESGLLTRQAYEGMGTVSGALAQHAEAVMDRIGADRHPLVRELFRNLVTAQGTRTVHDREQLLSVFPESDRSAAESILAELIDARLLTSYEMKDEDGKARRRIEIVHESLLKAWPRLVRWQTQDADSAQLRDQLRQAAQLWEQKGRTDDLLWTGTAYREFELWRERYPGGLSRSETSFAAAMAARETLRKRRRRFAFASSFLALLVVLAVVGGLWRKADRETWISEARRLPLLAEEVMESDNTLALALATASLAREDKPETRQLAMRALWKSPVRFVMTVEDTLHAGTPALLSPDGQWLATVNEDGALLWPRNGNEPLSLVSEETETPFQTRQLAFHPEGDFLAATRRPKDLPDRVAPGRDKITLWTIPDGERLKTWDGPEVGFYYPFPRHNSPRMFIALETDLSLPTRWLCFDLESESPTSLGPWGKPSTVSRIGVSAVDPGGRFLVGGWDRNIYLSYLDNLDMESPLLVGHHDKEITRVVINDRGDLIVSSDRSGRIKVWSRIEDGRFRLISTQSTLPQQIWVGGFDPSNTRVIFKARGGSRMEMVSLLHPGSLPIALRPSLSWPGQASFTPEGDWVVFPWTDERFGGGKSIFFYSLAKTRPETFKVFPAGVDIVDCFFLPDGSRVVGRTVSGELWLSELSAEGSVSRLLWENPAGEFQTFGTGPLGNFVLVNGFNILDAWLVPVDGSEPQLLDKLEGPLGGIALDPHSSRAAASGTFIKDNLPDRPVIRIHDLDTGLVQEWEAEGESGFIGLHFLADDRLIAHGNDGLILWDLMTGEYEALSRERQFISCDLDASQNMAAFMTFSGAVLWDIEKRIERTLPLPKEPWSKLVISPNGEFVAMSGAHGELLVLPLDSNEPHVLWGHDKPIKGIWISPDSDEIRTASSDGTFCIWEVPNGPRTQNLPHDELLAVLRAQTNMRIVFDADSKEGYRIEYDPFPGWETAPEW
jgi:serine/threonine protein kinase/WD40 repeat protein